MMPNYDAEQALIGCIMLEPNKVIPLAIRELSGEEFRITEFRTVFESAKKIWKDKRAVDAVTILAELGPNYRETVIGAANCVPSISHANDYIKAIAETNKRFKTLEITQDLIIAAESGDMGQCRKDASEISKILIQNTKIREIDAKGGYLDFMERAGQKKEYIKLGISKIDKAVFVEPGDYVVIGGRPSSGKTALTLQMMLKIAETEKVIYFSLETSKEKIMDRLICNFTRTPMSQIKSGEITQWDSIVGGYDDFKNLKFEIVEAAGWTTEQIEAKAIQEEAKVIFIDYLGLIRGTGKDLYERVTNISIDLHTMAQDNKIAVFALSQLNRAGEREPSMEDLRQSGQIEQDADCILLLWAVDKNNPASDRELIVAKNKEGCVGKIRLDFHGQYQLFTQIESTRNG